MTDRELFTQALDALTRIWEDGLENYPVWAHEAAIDNLRERLAQPEQDAVLAEREACAALVEENAMVCHSPIYRSLLQSNAQAIRERGKT